MNRQMRQGTALVLAVLLLAALIPGAAAAEVRPPDRPEDVSEVLRPLAALPQGAASGCPAAQLAVWWSNTLEPNPEGVEDFYIYYEFPKGQKKMRDNVGLHTVQVDGDWKASYCIEPGIKDSVEYNADKMTLEQWLKSPQAPSTLTEQQMKAIATILLYGQVERPTDGQYEELANMLATQILIWEVALEWRDAEAPYRRSSDAFIRRFADAGVGVMVSSYFLDIPEGTRVRGVTDAYDRIARNLERHEVIPSFMSADKAQAPVIPLEPDGQGNFTATVTDRNQILEAYTLENTEGLTFTRTGNKLTITAKQAIPDTVVTGAKQVPSVKDQAYYVWFSGAYQQMAACAAPPAAEPAPAYFRVTTPRGSVRLMKQTSTGQELEGWKIGLYRDEACKDPLPGSPFTTGRDGTVTIPGLIPGVYYAREVAEPAEHPYWKFDPAVKKVTVETGKTAYVSFLNTKCGKLKIIKKMESPGPLEGWKFRITDEWGTEIPGSPFTSGMNGELQTANLKPGTYTVEELLPKDSPYFCLTPNPQKVKVRPGEKAAVTFTNALRTGQIAVEKVDLFDEPLAGAEFRLEWSRDGKAWAPVFYADSPGPGSCSDPEVKDGCLLSGKDGLLCWTGLQPDLQYRITETKAPAGYNLLPGTAYEGPLPKDGAAIKIRVVNTPVFELPRTGKASFSHLSAGLALCAASCVGVIVHLKKKEE